MYAWNFLLLKLTDKRQNAIKNLVSEGYLLPTTAKEPKLQTSLNLIRRAPSKALSRIHQARLINLVGSHYLTNNVTHHYPFIL
jgi:hypothetical protein